MVTSMPHYEDDGDQSRRRLDNNRDKWIVTHDQCSGGGSAQQGYNEDRVVTKGTVSFYYMFLFFSGY